MTLWTLHWFHNGTFMQRTALTLEERDYVMHNVTSQGGQITQLWHN